MNIIWKPIEGYEGWYEVGDNLQVRSLDRRTTSRSAKGQVLKLNTQNGGYRFVPLHKNGKTNNKLLHRLIAAAFVPNPNNYKFVNHINGLKTDNRIENLER